jgi:AraC family transcriptional regulator
VDTEVAVGFAATTATPHRGPPHVVAHVAPVAATLSLISRATGWIPSRVVQSHSSGVSSFAIWPFTSARIDVEALPLDILGYLRNGNPRVTRRVNGRSVSKRLTIGAVTFVPHGVRTAWQVDGAGEFVQISVSPGVFCAFANEHFDVPSPLIADFFAIHDPWLTGYFEMLISEYDTFFDERYGADALLLSEMEHALVKHLLKWHSFPVSRSDRLPTRSTSVSPLRPVVLRRVEEFIDANLGDEVTLRMLAAIATLSVEHFVRSFRSATGRTPYRYVLEERLKRAAHLLRTSDQPIFMIATACGFKNPNYFSTKFHERYGIRPSHYRSGQVGGR